MANVNIQLIRSEWLNSGEEKPYGWKNPPVKKVLGFWVTPRAMKPNELLPGPVAFQITSVTTTMDQPDHYVVTVNVKNTSKHDFGFELYMSYLS
jgi:hypothetical protein